MISLILTIKFVSLIFRLLYTIPSLVLDTFFSTFCSLSSCTFANVLFYYLVSGSCLCKQMYYLLFYMFGYLSIYLINSTQPLHMLLLNHSPFKSFVLKRLSHVSIISNVPIWFVILIIAKLGHNIITISSTFVCNQVGQD